MLILYSVRQSTVVVGVRCPSPSGRSKLDKIEPGRTDDPVISCSRSPAHDRLVALAFLLFSAIGALWISATPGGTFAEGIRQMQAATASWTLHLPIAMKGLPPAQARLRGDGVHEGCDCRGVK
jgi:hypothetical protein